MLKVTPIQAFHDNYIWAIVHPKNQQTVVVDPGDAKPVLDFLTQQQLSLAAILTTHHHADHVGGVQTLASHANIPVYGPAKEPIPCRDYALSEGDVVTLKEIGCEFKIIDCPGHTAGHIAYYEPMLHWLFCGDTLFASGCGRLFEGTAEQMHDSLNKFAALPHDTQIFCAHEYTLANLDFAKKVEPDNKDIQQRIADTQQLRNKDQPSLPSNMALELKTNPFLRCDQQSVIDAAKQQVKTPLQSEADVLKVIRQWKDG